MILLLIYFSLLDGDGEISLAELTSAMNGIYDNLGLPSPSSSDIADMMMKYDLDKNGSLSLEEYGGFVKEILTTVLYS
jgi:Ca2+-binding EF-hand superfamily protein